MEDCQNTMPVHKKSPKTLKENYRPISILPTPSKIMEKLVHHQFEVYLEKAKILPRTQFGFRKGRSTIQAVGAAQHDWLQAKQSGLKCGALLFDLSAAFDMIDADILVDKLTIYGAGKSVTGWLRSYLSERSQCVEVDGARSTVTKLNHGSPQGSVISPLLFLVMVADLPLWVSKCQCLGFADDTTIYAYGKDMCGVRESLEIGATEVLSFMESNKFCANAGKTKLIIFGRKTEAPLLVGTVWINESPSEELLGIVISKSLSFKNHIDTLESKLRKKIGFLRKLSQTVPRSAMIKMMQPIFTANLLYGLSLFVDVRNANDSNLKRLNGLHRQAMKASLGLPRRSERATEDLLKMTGQKPVEQMARKQLAGLACDCLSKHGATHDLTTDRLIYHIGQQRTRQMTGRTFPPQPVPGSIVTKMVEMFEVLPENIKEEQNISRRKKMIDAWLVEAP